MQQILNSNEVTAEYRSSITIQESFLSSYSNQSTWGAWNTMRGTHWWNYWKGRSAMRVVKTSSSKGITVSNEKPLVETMWKKVLGNCLKCRESFAKSQQWYVDSKRCRLKQVCPTAFGPNHRSLLKKVVALVLKVPHSKLVSDIWTIYENY